MSLSAARSAALGVREDRQAGTIAVLTEAYLRSINGLRSASEIERRLRRDVLPVIGNVPLAELHRRDVTRVIDVKIVDAPIAARRVFEDIRAMVRWAVARGDLDHNPLDGMKGPAISKPRARVLTEDEIKTLWLALPQLRSIHCQRIIKLCLITGQRIGEVVGLRQSELDLKTSVWNIPGSRTKNGYPHSVPLSAMALEIINQTEFKVFAPRNVTQAIRRAYARMGLAQFTPHDLRRSALTGMAKLGVTPIVIANVANHRSVSKAGVTLGIYIQHTYEKEKREALELWADRLQGIVSGGAEVVAMRRN
jgi:integrase